MPQDQELLAAFGETAAGRRSCQTLERKDRLVMMMTADPNELQSRLRLFVDCERDLTVNVYGSGESLRTLANRLLQEIKKKPEPSLSDSSAFLFHVSADRPWSYPKHMVLCFHLETPEGGQSTYEHFAKYDRRRTIFRYLNVALSLVGISSIGYYLWGIAF